MALKKKCPVCETINEQIAMCCKNCGSELSPEDTFDDSIEQNPKQPDNETTEPESHYSETGFQQMTNSCIYRKCECGEVFPYSIQKCNKCGRDMSLGTIVESPDTSAISDDKTMEIRSDDGKAKLKLHSGDELTLGYDAELSTYFNPSKPYVSGKHAVLSMADGRLRIKHIGNTNPTLVNGKEIEKNKLYILREGDTFSLGAREGQGYVSKAAYFKVYIP